MKTKLFKRIGLLGLSALAAFTLTSNVKAEEQCTTYTNYYFFNEINALGTYTDGTANGATWERSHYTYFPGLPSDKTIDSTASGKICLSKNGNADTSGSCVGTPWDLVKFYDEYKKLINNGTKREGFSIPNGTEGSTTTFYVEYDAGSNTKYIKHGAWTSQQGGVIDNSGEDYVNFSLDASDNVIATNTIVNGSFIPETGIEFSDVIGYDALQAHVSRKIVSSNLSGVNAYNSKYNANTVLTPAFYKIVYKANCGEKYKAVINYYYWDMKNDKKPENPERVIFEDETKPNPYTEGNLNNGYESSTPVVSPKAANPSCTPMENDVTIKIKGEDFIHDVYYKCSSFNANIHYCIEKEDGTCIPATDVDKDAKDYSKTGLANGATDKKESYNIKNCKLKKDSDKTVEYTINNADFEYEVRYICDEETPVNPKTGIALIIAAWVVGLGALGYSAYYFMNARKEENAEL